jgi:hypothetical protein
MSIGEYSTGEAALGEQPGATPTTTKPPRRRQTTAKLDPVTVPEAR